MLLLCLNEVCRYYVCIRVFTQCFSPLLLGSNSFRKFAVQEQENGRYFLSFPSPSIVPHFFPVNLKLQYILEFLESWRENLWLMNYVQSVFKMFHYKLRYMLNLM